MVAIMSSEGSCQACGGLGYIRVVNQFDLKETRRPCTWCPAPKREQAGAIRSEGNVRILPQLVTLLDLPVERILAAAQTANLKRCIVVGEEQDGTLYFAATFSDGPEVLWALEQAKVALMQAGGAG